MYNKVIYNSALYNRYTVTVWRGTAEGVSEAIGKLVWSGSLRGSAEAVSEGVGLLFRIIRMGGTAEALSEQISTISAYDKKVLTLEGLILSVNDVLEIDTDTMCVYLNDVLIIDKVADSAVYFPLLPGANNITITGSGTVDIEIVQKDRWL